MSADQPVNRRSFFRQGLRGLLRPLASKAEPLEKMAKQLGGLESSTPPASMVRPDASSSAQSSAASPPTSPASSPPVIRRAAGIVARSKNPPTAAPETEE